MSENLLQTKLFVPHLRPSLVARPRLIQRLDQGLRQGAKLTLISAPAGFGKTTLITTWIAALDRPSAWLSLDQADSNPARFLAYLIAAIQRIDPRIGQTALPALQSNQPPDAVLTALLNEIAARPAPFLLVLDDYHIVDARPVDEALAFLLDHLPPQMHLAITTREDPNLPLSRLRVRGQLTELRSADLRFTRSEAARFLHQVMGLTLSEEDIAALEARTEGWIAGLQLAALSMQGRTDTRGFIKAFAGDNRYVVDYLLEEVLQRQPEHVGRFLLQTSILDRLNGPLCTAVTGQENGQAMLESLERGNLFVVPLDDKRRWFRYHHLFADVLHAHMLEEQPAELPTLHQRASRWYEENDQPADAIRHALIARDFDHAAALIELAWREMDITLQSDVWLDWVKALPEKLIQVRPVLSVGYGWALLNVSQLEAAETRLQDAERWLGSAEENGKHPPPPADQMIVTDENEFRLLPGTIAAARAYSAQARGDIDSTVTYIRQALDLFPEDAYLNRAVPAALLGLTCLARGDLEAAYQAFAESMSAFQKGGNFIAGLTAQFAMADIRVTQGRLRDAVAVYEQTLDLVEGQENPGASETADLHLCLSAIYRQRGQLAEAEKHRLKSESLGTGGSQIVYDYHLCLDQARQKEAAGDLDEALTHLDQAGQLFQQIHIPNVRPAAAMKVRLLLIQDRLNEALAWVKERELSADDDLTYLREFEHINLARILIAQYERNGQASVLGQALDLLERLLQAAETGQRMGSAIEILLLQALAHQSRDDIPDALTSLERALTLAEPEGYVRIFTGEGEPMARLLHQALARGVEPDYVRQLLTAFPAAASQPALPPPPPQVETGLVEQLSEREIEVLQFIAEGLTNREVAGQLYLSLHTVKVHARNIYGKLGVKNRTQAVAKARELGILTSI